MHNVTIKPDLRDTVDSINVVMYLMSGLSWLLLDILDKLQERIYRTVGPLLSAFLEPLAHRLDLTSLSHFCRYYFVIFSSEMAQLIPLPCS